MYNPANQIQVPTGIDLGSYYFKNKIVVGGFPYRIHLKKIQSHA
jgi:hypothetical protein